MSKLKIRRPGLSTEEVLEEQSSSDMPQLTGPVTGKVYDLTPFSIPSYDVQKVISKSQYNVRYQELLNVNAVADILPSIKENKRNNKPVLAIGPLHKLEILEGMRRTTAVSLIEDAELIGFSVVDGMDIEDQRAMSGLSDVYVKPSALEFSMFLKQHPDIAKRSLRDLAKEYGYGKTTVALAKEIANLPKEVLQLFPTAQSISLKRINNLVKNSEPKALKEACECVGSYKNFLTQDELMALEEGEPLEQTKITQLATKVTLLLESLLDDTKPREDKQIHTWLEQPANTNVNVMEHNGSLVIKFKSEFNFEKYRNKIQQFLNELE